MFVRRAVAILMIIGGWIGGFLAAVAGPKSCRELCSDLEPGEACQLICITHYSPERIALGAAIGATATLIV